MNLIQSLNLGLAADNPKLSPPSSQPSREDLEQVCTRFSSLFFQTLWKGMYATIPKSTFCPEFQGKELVKTMVDQNMALVMASWNGSGLKELLVRELLKEGPGQWSLQPPK